MRLYLWSSASQWQQNFPGRKVFTRGTFLGRCDFLQYLTIMFSP